MGQVLSNLISNAIKYSPNGGTVRVELRAEGVDAVIKVSDEGIGISVDDQQRIFEPFRRTNLTKMSIPGVGLGLSVVRRIVFAHQGRIEVNSAPNAGATFTVRLPLEVYPG
ncbi:MAG: ATP-binding protein [Bdellovibrionaceae bacterium]|nr:ATP-binding protein [Pseudobdellovibrionaceae bacterium]